MAMLFRLISTCSRGVSRLNLNPTAISVTRISRRTVFNTVLEDKNKRYPLSSVAKVELLENESAERIREIWLQYHSKKPCLSAVIPTSVADKLSARLRESPTFVYPLPSPDTENDYAVMYQQTQGNTVQYTTVEQFNRYKQGAIPFLSLFFFDELAKSKDVVLMRGDVNTDVMTVEQAQMLVHHMQIYYLADNHHEFVRMFNHRPNEFDFNMLLLNTRAVLTGKGLRSGGFQVDQSNPSSTAGDDSTVS